MKRRVLIAKALSHEPKVLFLDEPTASVDVELRKDMWEIVKRLKKHGVTIILTTHYIEEAEEIADRDGIINKGKIILVEEKDELIKKMVQKKLIIDLHEDNESHGYYLYQTGLSNKHEKIGLEILNSLEGIMPINLETEIAGSQADQGIIGKELEILSMDWWPMALYGLSKGTQMCLTLETSSLFDMETRVHAHLTAIKTTFNHLQ